MLSLLSWELAGHKLDFGSLSIGMKAADSFMFHYLWNVYCGIREQSHITGWYSPFNHPPSSAPHPCNHVSSYIIAFQLLTGVWPLPPNMPNLIHVFYFKTEGCLVLVDGGEKKKKVEARMNMLCHAVTIKRDVRSFLIQPRKSTAIFSRTYSVHGAWKWCKHAVRFGLDRRGE